MITADDVKEKIQGLIDSANAKTGAEDSTLTAAVNTLIAGFGSGGGGGLPNGISAVSTGTVTYSESQTSMDIDHGLGVKPDAIWVYIPDFTFPAARAEILGFFWCGYPRRVSAAATAESGAVAMTATTDYTGFVAGGLDVTVTDTSFSAGRNSSAYYYNAGNTYRWCAVKFTEAVVADDKES